MASTFMGLETSKRGLSVQQSALYTTGHNISNANTIGYSRQTVQMTPTNGFPGLGMNSPKIPGYLGTGATAGSITRVRDQFIDNQFRQETTNLGFWGSKTDAVKQLEDIFSEPSSYGLNTAFDDFYKAMQDISTTPTNDATRQVAVEKASHLADTFNYINKQLTQVQGDLKNQINVETKNVNSILEQILQLNKQIATVEPNGYLPNDLYDARDNLVDQLSQYIPITITKESNGGNSQGNAEGTYIISMKLGTSTDGKPDTVELVNKKDAAKLTAQTTTVALTDANFTEDEGYTPFSQFNIVMGGGGAGKTVSMAQMSKGMGVLQSLVDSYGHVEKSADGSTLSAESGTYPKKINDLNKLAAEFAKEFNEIHKSGGFTLGQDGKPSVAGKDFFVMSSGTEFNASNIAISEEIKKDYSQIAASSKEGESGNGTNAI
ncbi:MAG: flagellar hook-associated protein FlgK, partial [Kurthia sp.]